jgi:hypothetical protein
MVLEENRDKKALRFVAPVPVGTKVKILKSEAEQCIGELAFAVGKTTVEVEVDIAAGLPALQRATEYHPS